jgi:hypothetical protein
MVSRRGFLGAILAAATAPAVARSGILMPVKQVWVPDQKLAVVPSSEPDKEYGGLFFLRGDGRWFNPVTGEVRDWSNLNS